MEKRRDQERPSAVRRSSETGQTEMLYEIGARDEWQSVLITSDGEDGGRVVRKVVEPASYLVRYLVLFRPEEQQHLLLPASTVIGADLGELYCNLSKGLIDRLPPYHFEPITRPYEEQLYHSIGVTPHWVEEHPTSPGGLD